MPELPFPAHRSLIDTLKSDYLVRPLKWLGDFQDVNSTTLLGAKTGSLWGIGYTLRCLIDAREIYLDSGEFLGNFDTKAKNAIHYLIDKAVFGRNSCNWEGVVWDTAAITRAMLHYARCYPEESKELKVLKICEQSLRWMSHEVQTWHTNRYTLGITDLAQVLRTFVGLPPLQWTGESDSLSS